ncbi:SUMO-activating enzyme subunit 1 [Octopus bimaculoides]|uniref:SUMO-activating enzyme subunit 1 n=1 Tax=Octopus bimaculoides TaxID=37653 RepID=A0A0L8H8Z8_OCTBM|nr:SUMO-activating enzyme subunit 1 [Octopus bimaculoides]|eukprot:XP_014774405.1 PREDICTED: SUMO-activating enzyme subunit 1-like [Octopus bimaculoides]
MVEERLSEDEAALYDRQIRLWGLEAQKRLRAAKVLLVGLSGLGAEVAKNIVLSGINSLTLLDHKKVTEEDRCNQFLVSRDDVGRNRAEASQEATQKLNPLVKITVDTSNVDDKPDTFFQQFNVICITSSCRNALCRINKLCHEHNIKFFATDAFGYFGFMFSDLGSHEFAEEIPKPKPKETEESENGEPKEKRAKIAMETVVVKNSSEFVRFESALKFDWSTEENQKRLKRTAKVYFIMQVMLKFLERHGRHPSVKSKTSDMEELMKLRTEVLESLSVKQEVLTDYFVSHCFAELCPVSAIVGGVLSQEIIKAVSQKDKPHNNFFFFDGINGTGLVEQIG